jgi:membrane-bound ClpP family serine protease
VIKSLIRTLIAGLVLWLLYVCISMAVVALAAPGAHLILVVVAICLILCFIAFIVKEFGLWGGDL